MSDTKSSGSRRKLLKSIAAGSGAVVAGKSLPESWSRPIVDSVLLPAHAQTSPGTPPAPPIEGLAGYYSASGIAQTDDGLLDALIPTANAGTTDVCFYVRESGAGLMQIKVDGRVYVGAFRGLPFDTTLVWLNNGTWRINATGNVVNGSMVGTVVHDAASDSYSAPKSAVACSLDSSNPPDQAKLLSIQLRQNTSTVIDLNNPLLMTVGGDDEWLTAWGTFEGVPTPQQITTQAIWNSSPRSVASMDLFQRNTWITANGVGEATVTAELFGVVGTAKVIVS